MDPVVIDTIIKLINGVGFSVFVAVCLLVRLEGTLKELTKAVNRMCEIEDHRQPPPPGQGRVQPDTPGHRRQPPVPWHVPVPPPGRRRVEPPRRPPQDRLLDSSGGRLRHVPHGRYRLVPRGHGLSLQSRPLRLALPW